MCGILACRTNESAIGYLTTGLRRLEYRGYDSVGVAVHTGGGDVTRLRAVGQVDQLEALVRQWAGPRFDGVGIGHTRWATHGQVTTENAHPHVDCSGRISLVHNGIIENADELRAELIDAGHRFATLVDSEVLCHLIEDARCSRSDLRGAVQDALAQVRGTWAIAVIEHGTCDVVVAASGSPMLLAHSALGDFATSDIAAVADWVDTYRVLDDGDVVALSDERSSASIRCEWRGSDVDLGGYPDFTAKEIEEQPEAAARVIDRLGGAIASGDLWRELGLPHVTRLHVIGCGTSLNAGNVIADFVRGVAGIPTTSSVGSEVRDEFAEPGRLCLVMSQSGETADILTALDHGASGGAPLLAVTNNVHSSLARRADAVLACMAGPERGVAATKTFVCQVIAGVAVMISGLVAGGRISASAARQMSDDLMGLPDRLAHAISSCRGSVTTVAEEHRSADGFVFIARGTGIPYAAEGALKLKELTYRWTEHCPAGELKHGPLALVDFGTPVVVVDNGDPKLACNIAEVLARGGDVISIGSSEACFPVLEFPVSPWGPLESVVPMQMLARSLALVLGRDVDKPRNLAKSVTVE